MTPAARLSAAIEIVADIEARHRPAPEALKDWGLSHRFAGSGDRAALAGLVYDALRRRASSVHVMGDPSPRAILLGMLRLERKLEPDAIVALANGGRFAPQPLSPDELARLAAPICRRAALGGQAITGMARSASRPRVRRSAPPRCRACEPSAA